MSSVLSKPHYHDEEAAYAFVEARIWPNGPTCPRCKSAKRVGKLQGRSTRMGVYKCYRCRKPFTVKVGTIFESSNVPMHKWLQAIFLLCSSKKGVSSNQLHRTLGVTLRTAWFMSHRIREAMRSGDLAPFGGGGGEVEIDETFIGREPGAKPKQGMAHKMKVLTLIDRQSGQARSIVVDRLTKAELTPILRENIAREAMIYSDGAKYYKKLDHFFAGHESVDHSAEEWARGRVSVNTVEGFYSIFKRGMRGVYQHCNKRHLHRYAAEFDFRYNNRVRLGVDDEERAERALQGVVGKRLTYRRTDEEVGAR